MSESTKDIETVVVIGQNVWGHDKTLEAAKKIFREQGGNLRGEYAVLVFPPGLEFEGVHTVFGDVSYSGEGEPVVTHYRNGRVVKSHA